MWQFLRAVGSPACSFLAKSMSVNALLLAGAVCSGAWATTVDSGGNGYIVVTDVAVSQEAGWQEVLATLQDVHNATVVTYRGDVRESLLELAARAPDYVAFLMPPEQAKPSQVWTLHRMMRELDDDPYTDALWGIVTGCTVVTWFGYGGWGVKDLLMGQRGRFCFSEAVFLNNQALLHILQTEHARYAHLQMSDYDHRHMNGILGRLVQRHGILHAA